LLYLTNLCCILVETEDVFLFFVLFSIRISLVFTVTLILSFWLVNVDSVTVVEEVVGGTGLDITAIGVLNVDY